MGTLLAIFSNIGAILAGVFRLEQKLDEIIIRLHGIKENIMAIGPETQKALDELSTKISNEVAELAEYAISVTNADNEVAAAIRARATDVSNIFTPANSTETQPGVQPAPDVSPQEDFDSDLVEDEEDEDAEDEDEDAE